MGHAGIHLSIDRMNSLLTLSAAQRLEWMAFQLATWHSLEQYQMLLSYDEKEGQFTPRVLLMQTNPSIRTTARTDLHLEQVLSLLPHSAVFFPHSAQSCCAWMVLSVDW